MPFKKLIASFCAAALLFSQGTAALASQPTGSIYDIGVNTDSAEEESGERIIVKFMDGTSTTTECRVNDQFETADTEKIDSDAYVVVPEEDVSPEELAEQYLSDSHVEYAEPDYPVVMSAAPNDSYYETYQSAVFDQMNIVEAWDISEGSSGIIVAVLDTGVDLSHPDLAGQVLSTGYDYVNNDDDPSDDNGHGTMCAGIIAACTNNGTGIAGAVDCSILPVKVLDSNGAGYISTIAKGIQYAVDQGADVISMSLGSLSASETLQEAVSDAYEAGIVVVAASGNSASSVNYPAACENAVAVGAVTSSGKIASYSCYGSELDLAAVGSDVFSTYCYRGTSTYATGSGTSFATPYVSALAALVLSADSSLSPDEVEEIMENTAADLGEPGWDSYYGYGCVDYGAALEELGGGNEDPEPEEDGEADGEIDMTPPVITLNGSSSVRVVVGSTYTDAGAAAYDDEDGDLTSSIVTKSTVNTARIGTYAVTYSVSDAAGNAAAETRTVVVAANTKPVITLNGSSPVKIVVGSAYVDAGATAMDAEDGDLTSSIVVTSTVKTTRVGSYRVTYSVTDSNGGTARVTRIVTVKANTRPVIKLNGSTVRVVVGTAYVDAGATATDAEDGDLTSSIVVTSTVNTEKIGTYKVTYSVTDSHGATSKITRTVIVRANTKPVIKIKGRTTVTIKVGSAYTDAGATATDAEDGNLTASIVTTSTVDTLVAGRYKVTYTVTDSHGGTATATRTVVVR